MAEEQARGRDVRPPALRPRACSRRSAQPERTRFASHGTSIACRVLQGMQGISAFALTRNGHSTCAATMQTLQLTQGNPAGNPEIGESTMALTTHFDALGAVVGSSTLQVRHGVRNRTVPTPQAGPDIPADGSHPGRSWVRDGSGISAAAAARQKPAGYPGGTATFPNSARHAHGTVRGALHCAQSAACPRGVGLLFLGPPSCRTCHAVGMKPADPALTRARRLRRHACPARTARPAKLAHAQSGSPTAVRCWTQPIRRTGNSPPKGEGAQQ